ncbi:MAG: DUF4244 domain-containing protein [Aeromicrobium sp.]|uniref:DUF4244 domain-containing protein n=1 Tax=Aeromicrobium sp. TaxID=1871063 RepID=UPI0039E2A9A9
MRRLITAASDRDEQGMSTSEYAFGTIGACSIGGLIYWLTQDGFFLDMLRNLFLQFHGVWPRQGLRIL